MDSYTERSPLPSSETVLEDPCSSANLGAFLLQENHTLRPIHTYLTPSPGAPQLRPPRFKFPSYLPFYLVPLDKGLHLSYVTLLFCKMG